MKTTTLFTFTAMALLLLIPPTVARQQPAAKSGMMMKMPEHCKMMMQMHEKMQASNKAQDAKLKELIAQRSSHQKRMDQMQPQMMGHMMEHMQSGDKNSMMQCPVMKDGGMMGHDMSKMKSK